MSLGHLISDLTPEIFLRIGLTFLASFVLGLERERHGRAAGLRTTITVAVASCVAMLISDLVYRASFQGAPSTWHPDPARLAAGVLSGMGFLGAGVIIHSRHSNITRGVTTAALLWFASILGLAFGSGALGLGLLATALGSIILFVLPRVEERIANDWYADLSIQATYESSVPELIKSVEANNVQVKGINWKEHLATNDRSLRLHLKFKSDRIHTLPNELIAHLSSLPGIKSIHWHG